METYIDMVEVAPKIWVPANERESGFLALLKYWIRSIIVWLKK